jgi:diadenosine tetraphosphate (Ap4A) HIT family hydrolase
VSEIRGCGTYVDGCYACTHNRRDPADLPPRERIVVGDGWRVVHAIGTTLPGWLVLVSRRHVLTRAQLTDTEAAELGLLTARVSRALEAVLGCAKTYSAAFAEAAGFAHLHIHLAPARSTRPPTAAARRCSATSTSRPSHPFRTPR